MNSVPLRELVYPYVRVYAIRVLFRATDKRYEGVTIEIASIFLRAGLFTRVIPYGIDQGEGGLPHETAGMSLRLGIR